MLYKNKLLQILWLKTTITFIILKKRRKTKEVREVGEGRESQVFSLPWGQKKKGVV